jgi:hypothetical protein
MNTSVADIIKDLRLLAGRTLGYADFLKLRTTNVVALLDDYDRLAKENAMLRGSLIKTPTELHRISEGVKRMGFPGEGV